MICLRLRDLQATQKEDAHHCESSLKGHSGSHNNSDRHDEKSGIDNSLNTSGPKVHSIEIQLAGIGLFNVPALVDWYACDNVGHLS